MNLYKDYIEELTKKVESKSELSSRNGQYFAAKQLLELHADASQRENPIILELGVERGASTKIFLNAIANKPSASLISVDIEDCSSAASSEKWTFIKSDSTNVEAILRKAPVIKERGIDLLYIDSTHSAKHVQKEVEVFYPFLKKGASIFFDDCDYFPYMRNQRKDNAAVEFGLRKIKILIEDIFRSNLEDLELCMHYGSTGLARLKKTSEKGEPLKQVIHYKGRGYLSAIFALPFSYLLKKIVFKALGAGSQKKYDK